MEKGGLDVNMLNVPSKGSPRCGVERKRGKSLWCVRGFVGLGRKHVLTVPAAVCPKFRNLIDLSLSLNGNISVG